jgi:hypothetical protein
VGGNVRHTLVLVIIGGASVGALATGLAISSLLLDGLGTVGIVAATLGLLNRGLRAFLDWFVSRTT